MRKQDQRPFTGLGDAHGDAIGLDETEFYAVQRWIVVGSGSAFLPRGSPLVPWSPGPLVP